MLRRVSNRLRLSSSPPENRNSISLIECEVLALIPPAAEPQASLDQVPPAASERKVSGHPTDVSSLRHDVDDHLQPRAKLPKRSPSPSSMSDCSSHTLDSTPASIHLPKSSVFRYLELLSELQHLVITFAFGSSETPPFPSYDYLTADEDSQGSGPFIHGHRLWLTPRFHLKQLLVSEEFLEDAIRVLGLLKPMEVFTLPRREIVCGGVVVGGSPLRGILHPRKRFEPLYCIRP